MAETFDVAFEGGGIKGGAFLGALEVLFRKHRTRRLIGTSAGALTATCLAAGYTPQELLEILLTHPGAPTHDAVASTDVDGAP